MYNQRLPNVHDHISNVNGIDINLAKWILQSQTMMESLENTWERKTYLVHIYKRRHNFCNTNFDEIGIQNYHIFLIIPLYSILYCII